MKRVTLIILILSTALIISMLSRFVAFAVGRMFIIVRINFRRTEI